MFKVNISKERFVSHCKTVTLMCKENNKISNDVQRKIFGMSLRNRNMAYIIPEDASLARKQDVKQKDCDRWDALVRTSVMLGMAAISEDEFVVLDEEVYNFLYNDIDKFKPHPKWKECE